MQNLVRVYNLGRLEYTKCLKVQKYLLNKKLNLGDQNDNLILVEHDPIYTVGIRRSKYSEADLNKLRSLNAQVEYTDRGGLITFHGPGQLVAYPILNLKNYNPSLKWYVSQLEQLIIDLCKKNFDLKASRMCNVGYTGVWANDTKIAAIGVHCKKYITYHGLALNCNTDLNWFNYIIPCGIEDKSVGSLTKLLNKNVSIEHVEPMLLKSFESVFKARLDFKSVSECQELVAEAEKF